MSSDENDRSTEQVLEYFKKYSQNRNLPKYFSGTSVVYLPPIAVEQDVCPSHRDPDHAPQVNIIVEDSSSASEPDNRKLEWDNGADIGYDSARKNSEKVIQKSSSLPILSEFKGPRPTPKPSTIITHSTSSKNVEVLVYGDSSSKSRSSLSRSLENMLPSPSAGSLAKSKVGSSSNSSETRLAEFQSTIDYLKRKIGLPGAQSTPNFVDNQFAGSRRCKSDEDVAGRTKIVELTVTTPINVNCKGLGVASSDKTVQTIGPKTAQTESTSKLEDVADLASSFEYIGIGNTNNAKVISKEVSILKHSSESEDIDKHLEILHKLLKTNKKLSSRAKRRYLKVLLKDLTELDTSTEASSSSELFVPKKQVVDGAVKCRVAFREADKVAYGRNESSTLSSMPDTDKKCESGSSSGKPREQFPLQVVSSESSETKASNSDLKCRVADNMENGRLKDVYKCNESSTSALGSSNGKQTKQFSLQVVSSKTKASNSALKCRVAFNKDVYKRNKSSTSSSTPNDKTRSESGSSNGKRTEQFPLQAASSETKASSSEIDKNSGHSKHLPSSKQFPSAAQSDASSFGERSKAFYQKIGNRVKIMESKLGLSTKCDCDAIPEGKHLQTSQSVLSSEVLKSDSVQEQIPLSITEITEGPSTEVTTPSSTSRSKDSQDYLLKFAENERAYQLNWINNEISHLSKLKSILELKARPTKSAYKVIRNGGSSERKYVIETDLGGVAAQQNINYRLDGHKYVVSSSSRSPSNEDGAAEAAIQIESDEKQTKIQVGTICLFCKRVVCLCSSNESKAAVDVPFIPDDFSSLQRVFKKCSCTATNPNCGCTFVKNLLNKFQRKLNVEDSSEADSSPPPPEGGACLTRNLCQQTAVQICIPPEEPQKDHISLQTLKDVMTQYTQTETNFVSDKMQTDLIVKTDSQTLKDIYSPQYSDGSIRAKRDVLDQKSQTNGGNLMVNSASQTRKDIYGPQYTDGSIRGKRDVLDQKSQTKRGNLINSASQTRKNMDGPPYIDRSTKSKRDIVDQESQTDGGNVVDSESQTQKNSHVPPDIDGSRGKRGIVDRKDAGTAGRLESGEPKQTQTEGNNNLITVGNQTMPGSTPATQGNDGGVGEGTKPIVEMEDKGRTDRTEASSSHSSNADKSPHSTPSDSKSSASSRVTCFCCKQKAFLAEVSYLDEEGNDSLALCSRCFYQRPRYCGHNPRFMCRCWSYWRAAQYCRCCRKQASKCPKRLATNGLMYTVTLPVDNKKRSRSSKEDNVKVHKGWSGKSLKNKENYYKRDVADVEQKDNGNEHTLMEYLIKNRPEFIYSAEYRRQMLLNSRILRERQKDNLKLNFLQNNLGNLDGDKYKLFTERQMKQINKKNYKKLPEVQRKLVNQRETCLRQADRLISIALAKKVQKSVLKGKGNFPIDRPLTDL